METWQIEFNVDKGEFIRFDRRNQNVIYYLNGEELQNASGGSAEDMGVLVPELQKIS